MQALEDAKQDRTSIPYEGITPNKMVCDTTLRLMPDKSWIISMLAGDDFEPSPKNYIGISRSTDEGRTWSSTINCRDDVSSQWCDERPGVRLRS